MFLLFHYLREQLFHVLLGAIQHVDRGVVAVVNRLLFEHLEEIFAARYSLFVRHELTEPLNELVYYFLHCQKNDFLFLGID